ncbi:MAG: DUF4252 domain-containing protein [Bacteroidetes bacterium]|jgi:hypothetical protein|nr:DUF4252 domain-containing protein [Bacteroidota bacterium]
MKHRLLIPLALLLFVLPMTGCFYSREIAQTRRDIERDLPGADFEREVVVNLGPLSLRTLRWFTGLSEDDDARHARLLLRDLRRVKVGVYRNERALASLEAVDLPQLRRLERDGWEPAVVLRERDEVVHVYYREHRGTVRDLYVVALAEDELVLARLRGHLGRVLARALQDDETGWHDLAEIDW